MISVSHEILSNFGTSSSREWLETNGIGGYASGTIAGANSRRYHGLLVAATRPPLDRMVLLSKFEESISIAGETFELSSNRYPGLVHPDGYRHLTSFRLDPYPIWTYEIDGLEIERSIFMVAGENTTVCQWRVSRAREEIVAPVLRLRPLVAYRDHHHLRHEHAPFDESFEIGDHVVVIRPLEEQPSLYFSHNAYGVKGSGYWYRNFEYAIEEERGFDHSEDLFQPFVLAFSLQEPASVIVSTGPHDIVAVDKLRKNEMRRRAKLVAVSGAKDDLRKQLILAADQFIVDRGEGKTVIAGYHWFSDWGRDTMIALPGLTLSTGRHEIAKSIILEFSKHISQGMLPNRFPDACDEPEYNTVDATLWYFEAIRAYVEHTSDDGLARALFDKLQEIVDWHIRGTRYGIKVDDDGLLNAGDPGVQLTWMDAKIGDWVVTPRTGKAVEIQALWFNALCIMRHLADRFERPDLAKLYGEMADAARSSFNEKFWYAEGKYLYDVIDADNSDASLRPNQIFAVSLRHPMLDGPRARRVVDVVGERLLTPVGLRSLDQADPRYVPIYIGSPLQRDSSYHQGTVWGWLIGPFVDAYRRAHVKDRNLEKRVRQMLTGFVSHLSETGVGQISEIFDGDEPHAPRGCVAQAWSVAEVLRVLS